MNSFEDRQNMKNKTSCAIVVTSIFDNLWIERISKEIIKMQIAFYSSTPTYRNIAKIHGFDKITDELSKLARLKKWNDMRKLITDSMLEEFTVISKPSKILDQIKSKYSNLLDRVTLYIPIDRNKIFWEEVLKNRT